MMRCPRLLPDRDLPAYRDHLCRLDAESRRLRFGHVLDNSGIERHVSQLRTGRDRIIAQVDDDGRVIAAAHVACLPNNAVELAFSVDEPWRGQGLGRTLFEHAQAWARNRGFRQAHLIFLVDNHAMRTLARHAGMKMTTEGGETCAEMDLPPATVFTVARELSAEQLSLFYFSVRRMPARWSRLSTPAGIRRS